MSEFILQLLPLALLILGALAIWFFAWREGKKRPEGAKIEGFGGWLLIVAICQWFGTLSLFADFLKALPEYEKHWSNPIARRVIMAEAGLTLGFVGFMIYVAIMMSLKRRVFPLLFRIELVLIVVGPLIILLWAAAVSDASLEKLNFGTEVTRSIGRAVGAAIWILYSLRSVRVRNTFVR